MSAEAGPTEYTSYMLGWIPGQSSGRRGEKSSRAAFTRSGSRRVSMSISTLATLVPSVRRDVLVPAEEVVRVVRPLQRLQPLPPLRPVGLADPVLALLHEKVHIDAGVERLQLRPEVAGPRTFLVEAFGRLRGGVDVDGVPGASSVERGVVLSHAVDGSPQLEDGERRQLRLHLERVRRDDVDDVVGEL